VVVDDRVLVGGRQPDRDRRAGVFDRVLQQPFEHEVEPPVGRHGRGPLPIEAVEPDRRLRVALADPRDDPVELRAGVDRPPVAVGVEHRPRQLVGGLAQVDQLAGAVDHATRVRRDVRAVRIRLDQAPRIP